MGTLRKADLHLHSRHSGWQRLPLIDSLDCYLDPVLVVETAIERGMDYVALTDHDSIGGWLELRARRPDLSVRVIPGAEVETVFPYWGLKVHVNFLGIDETTFYRLESLRRDIHCLLEYARENGITAILNHPLRTLWRHPRLRQFLDQVPNLFDGLEVVNSASPEVGNRAALALAELAPGAKARVGGSDAHTMARVARAYTVAEGDSAEEFLRNVRRGACEAAGAASGLTAVIADVYRVVGRYHVSLLGPMFKGSLSRRLWNFLWAGILLPGSALMPTLITALNDAQYRAMARWALRLARELDATPIASPETPAGLSSVSGAGIFLKRNIAQQESPASAPGGIRCATRL